MPAKKNANPTQAVLADFKVGVDNAIFSVDIALNRLVSFAGDAARRTLLRALVPTWNLGAARRILRKRRLSNAV